MRLLGKVISSPFLSYSHGSGLKNKDVPHIAKFSINATAAAILLLLEVNCGRKCKPFGVQLFS